MANLWHRVWQIFSGFFYNVLKGRRRRVGLGFNVFRNLILYFSWYSQKKSRCEKNWSRWTCLHLVHWDGYPSTLCWLQLEVLKPRRGVFGTTSITKMGLNWWKGCCDVNNHQALRELSAATSIISTVVVKLHSTVHIKQKHCTIANIVSLVVVPTLCLISTCDMES
jgi:hypothetical protein